jgi:myo-inositol-1(or 4)-monophosphatase
MDMIHQARQVAETLAKEAGKLAKEAFFRKKKVEVKDEFGDLVTEVDRQAERLIAEGIRKHFPNHRVVGEEFGAVGDPGGEWTWVVDPLDGTNNYAIGLPLYGVCIALLKQNEPVLGVVYDPLLDQLYTAEKGKGCVCNGMPVLMKTDTRRLPTISWVQGYSVRNDPSAFRLKQTLDHRAKRVLRLWAPSLAWCMLARGDLDAMVVYRSEGLDLFAGLLIAMEAGAEVCSLDGKPLKALSGKVSLVACRPERMRDILKLVEEGLGKLDGDWTTGFLGSGFDLTTPHA